MKVKLSNVQYNENIIPFISLKGGWLADEGFPMNSRIAICIEEYGSLSIINLDLVSHKYLEEKYKKQVYILLNEQTP